MKNVIFKLLLFCCIGLLSSCSKDDNNISTDIDCTFLPDTFHDADDAVFGSPLADSK